MALFIYKAKKAVNPCQSSLIFGIHYEVPWLGGGDGGGHDKKARGGVMKSGDRVSSGCPLSLLRSMQFGSSSMTAQKKESQKREGL